MSKLAKKMAAIFRRGAKHKGRCLFCGAERLPGRPMSHAPDCTWMAAGAALSGMMNPDKETSRRAVAYARAVEVRS